MPARQKALQFSLISIPVRLDVAKISRPTLSNLCVGQPGHAEHAPSPLKQPKTCDECGPVVDTSVLVKGKKSGQTYTLVDTEALEKAADEFITKQDALTIGVHPAAEFFAKTGTGSTLHWVVPTDASTAGHYQLIVRLVESHPEYAFAMLHTPSSVTSLYVLRVRDGVLLLEQRTREQQLKPAPSVGGEVNDGLYAVLDSTLEQFVTPYDPATYEDQYATALDTLIAEGETVTVGATTAAPAVPVMSDEDLMAKLAALAGAA